MLGLLGLLVSPGAVLAQTAFAYTGAVQTYTVPADAVGVTITAAGGGGGGGGADNPGNGGAGVAGARVTGTYFAAAGTVLTIHVGGGGAGGVASTGTRSCTTSAGAGGAAGGAAGLAGGRGGEAGCSGYSGGGGGGGAASVVSVAVSGTLVVAGGGGGGQGGALNIAGRVALNGLTTGTLPGGGGTVGDSPGASDGGGGGGGGGGCAFGAGGALNTDSAGSNNSRQASSGGSCRNSALISAFTVVGATGGAGGAGSTAYLTVGGAGGAGSVTITPVRPSLSLLKSQPAPALAVGVNSVYTLTVSNTASTAATVATVIDQLPAHLSYVSNSGTGWTCTAAANAGGTAVSCSFSGSIAASNGTATLQITVRPTSNLSVTNYAAVSPVGGASPPVATSCTAQNTPSAGCAAPVTSAVTLALSGSVYRDNNHNNSRDGAEPGIGGSTNLFVKLALLTGGVCVSPASVSVPVTLTTGAYTLPAVAQGSYCLILDTSATLSDGTPAYPADFIGTQNPTGIIQIVVGGAPPAPQNFGAYNGSQLSGQVFADNGAGGGVANNGQRTGGEPGLSGLTVNARQGASLLDSVITAADGSYTVWLPATASGTLTVTPELPAGYTATGGSAGSTTAGSYTRPSVNFTFASAQRYTGVNFGLVAANTLMPNGAQTAQPGTVVLYAHTYTAATGGTVTFTLGNLATPAVPWVQVLYLDTNCSATLEATEPQPSASMPLAAGQVVCLLIKQSVPAGAALGSQNLVTLSAAFSFTNASPALPVRTLTVTDTTTVGLGGDLSLLKQVGNITQGIAAASSVNASPGDILQYALTATNNGSKPLSTLFVSDATPAFTSYVSADCPATLPAGITACTVSTQPALGTQGALTWTLTGSLSSAGQVVVTYRVRVAQ